MTEYNHLLNFVWPTDWIFHTQGIEKFWSQAKRYFSKTTRLKTKASRIILASMYLGMSIEKKTNALVQYRTNDVPRTLLRD